MVDSDWESKEGNQDRIQPKGNLYNRSTYVKNLRLDPEVLVEVISRLVDITLYTDLIRSR